MTKFKPKINILQFEKMREKSFRWIIISSKGLKWQVESVGTYLPNSRLSCLQNEFLNKTLCTVNIRIKQSTK